MDRGTWWATVHGVANSRTQPSEWHFPFSGTNQFVVHMLMLILKLPFSTWVGPLVLTEKLRDMHQSVTRIPWGGAEELYKRDRHGPDHHDGVITHLKPDILQYEVKWALGSITTNKASGGDGIPVELFQILKDDAVKVLHSICQQVWKTQQWPQDYRRSTFIPIPKKGDAKECSNYCRIALTSHASKVMLKILQGRLQQYRD